MPGSLHELLDRGCEPAETLASIGTRKKLAKQVNNVFDDTRPRLLVRNAPFAKANSLGGSWDSPMDYSAIATSSNNPFSSRGS